MGTLQYDRKVRVAIAMLVTICLVQTLLMFWQHLQVKSLVDVTCAATDERLGRIDLYRGLIEDELDNIDEEQTNKFIDDELRAKRISRLEKRITRYEKQIGLVQATITAADFACEPQAGQYLLPGRSLLP